MVADATSPPPDAPLERGPPGEAAARSSARMQWGVVGAITAVALGLRIWGLGRDSLWIDEIYSVQVSMQSLREIVLFRDENPPLYYLLLHLWMQMFGSTDIAVRSLSVLFGTASIPLAFLFARRTLGLHAAWAAALLLAASTLHVRYSQETRTYALTGCMAILSMLLWTRTGGTHRRTRGGWAAATTALLYSHVVGALVYATQIVVAVARQRGDDGVVAAVRRAVPRWALVPGLLWIPWGLFVMTQRVSGLVASGRGGGQSLANVLLAGIKWFGNGELSALFLATILASAVVVTVHRRGVSLRRAAWGPDATLMVAWMVLPVAALGLLAPIYFLFSPRYLLPFSIPAFMLAGKTVAQTRPRWMGLALGLLLVVPSVWLVADEAQHGGSRAGWQEPVEYIEQNAEPGALVIFSAGFCDSDLDFTPYCGFDLYAGRDDLVRHGLPPPQLATDAHRESLHQALQGRNETWVFHSFYSMGGRLVEWLEEAGFTRDAGRNWPGIRVALFVAADGPPDDDGEIDMFDQGGPVG